MNEANESTRKDMMMGLFSKKDEQTDVYKVYSDKPKDSNNTTVIYCPTKETAQEKKQELSQRENSVKIKRV